MRSGVAAARAAPRATDSAPAAGPAAPAARGRAGSGRGARSVAHRHRPSRAGSRDRRPRPRSALRSGPACPRKFARDARQAVDPVIGRHDRGGVQAARIDDAQPQLRPPSSASRRRRGSARGRPGSAPPGTGRSGRAGRGRPAGSPRSRARARRRRARRSAIAGSRRRRPSKGAKLRLRRRAGADSRERGEDRERRAHRLSRTPRAVMVLNQASA